jgi:2-polyprenyl-3-methyl-5-hydroxy-6-metoxy-1,4-benzoquinol methylase
MAIQAIDVSQMNPGLSVLDVGGGKGELTKRIWRKKDENILIDANPPGALEGAKTKKCDLNDEWPIENSEIDVLFALEVIEHVENPRLFMREVKRVLKNGGVAFMSTPNNESLFSRLNFF